MILTSDLTGANTWQKFRFAIASLVWKKYLLGGGFMSDG